MIDEPGDGVGEGGADHEGVAEVGEDTFFDGESFFDAGVRAAGGGGGGDDAVEFGEDHKEGRDGVDAAEATAAGEAAGGGDLIRSGGGEADGGAGAHRVAEDVEAGGIEFVVMGERGEESVEVLFVASEGVGAGAGEKEAVPVGELFDDADAIGFEEHVFIAAGAVKGDEEGQRFVAVEGGFGSINAERDVVFAACDNAPVVTSAAVVGILAGFDGGDLGREFVEEIERVTKELGAVVRRRVVGEEADAGAGDVECVAVRVVGGRDGLESASEVVGVRVEGLLDDDESTGGGKRRGGIGGHGEFDGVDGGRGLVHAGRDIDGEVYEAVVVGREGDGLLVGDVAGRVAEEKQNGRWDGDCLIDCIERSKAEFYRGGIVELQDWGIRGGGERGGELFGVGGRQFIEGGGDAVEVADGVGEGAGEEGAGGSIEGLVGGGDEVGVGGRVGEPSVFEAEVGSGEVGAVDFGLGRFGVVGAADGSV